MATAQFAMVEELACLIKDNLSSKHVVLSIEEALINFLQDDTSPNGVLELEPMSPYHRMLLHRLADIYGFAHESVGEGDHRHLILERCPESSLDILWQYDEYLSPSVSQHLLRRKEDSPALKVKQERIPTSVTFRERQAAYLAARERIFAMDENQLNETSPLKQRNVPVVARRMIAHALGQRISVNTPYEQSTSSVMNVQGSNNVTGDNPDIKVHSKQGRKSDRDIRFTSDKNPNINRNRSEKPGLKCSLDSEFPSRKETHCKGGGSEISLSSNVLQSGSNSKDNLRRENYGAARRIFAQALGLPSVKQKS